MQQVLILAAEDTPRLIYVLNELLVRRLGISYKITTNEDYFLKSNSARINYGNQIIEGCINIPSHQLLYKENIIKQQISVEPNAKWTYCFFQYQYQNIPDTRKETHWLNFDLFAASFYLLSRYEEYLPSKLDAHGRFNHTESIAYKYNFLEIPLVDIWLIEAKKILAEFYPQLSFKEHVYKHINTIDIDSIYKYEHLSRITLFRKKMGHLIHNRKDALAQLKKFTKKQIPDPYDTYKIIFSQTSENVVFWLLSNNKHRFDNNHKIDNIAYKTTHQLLTNTHIKHGLHPSYYASVNPASLKKEKQNFKMLFQFEPNVARWHFLKINIPKSYEMLINTGFTEDWSMGYANTVGFRAGTCMPFCFFNLKTNEATNLTIMPVALMDVSLKNGLNLTVADAIDKVNFLKNYAKQVNGCFITIWHNSSFDETEGWLGWQKVFDEINKI